MPSRFLREIPRDLLNEVRPKVQVSRTASLGAARGGPVHGIVETAPIKLGANVEHPKFGGGVVVDYEGAERMRACRCSSTRSAPSGW